MREIAELRQRVQGSNSGSAPSGDDAFHDGTKVLSSVLNWHNYLRNSSRKADTATIRVLNLIEEKMLLQSPNKRLTFEQLCVELGDIIVLARNDYQKLSERGQLKTIAPNTLEALLHLDKRAPALATPIIQVNTDNTDTTTQNAGQNSGSLLPNDQSYLHPRSERVRKSERLERIVIGKTANREEAIKTDLGLGIVDEVQEIYDSPQQSPARSGKAVFDTSPLTENGQDLLTSNSTGKEKKIPVINIYDSPAVGDISTFPQPILDSKSSPPNDNQPPFKFLDSSSGNIASHSFFSPERSQRMTPPLQNTLKGKDRATNEHSGCFGYEEGISSTNQGYNIRTPVTPPELPKSTGRQMSTGSAANPAGGYDQPSNFISDSMRPPTPQMSPEPVPDQDAKKDPLGGVSPPSMQVLSYAIFDEYARLEKLWGDKKGLFSSLLSKIPDDAWLKNFISNRDIVGYSRNFFREKNTDLYNRFSLLIMPPL
jgi:hypothetical protein